MQKYSLYNQGITEPGLATNQKVGSSNLSGRTIKHLESLPPKIRGNSVNVQACFLRASYKDTRLRPST